MKQPGGGSVDFAACTSLLALVESHFGSQAVGLIRTMIHYFVQSTEAQLTTSQGEAQNPVSSCTHSRRPRCEGENRGSLRKFETGRLAPVRRTCRAFFAPRRRITGATKSSHPGAELGVKRSRCYKAGVLVETHFRSGPLTHGAAWRVPKPARAGKFACAVL